MFTISFILSQITQLRTGEIFSKLLNKLQTVEIIFPIFLIYLIYKNRELWKEQS